ncbi:class I SAM-dependent methyltransferase [Caulobacter sp.]|uniref:class I SAM-dependent methyltransferase n=1 Tax=Caulobacter sp. TaxID=78 RepID=UPI001B1BEB77|nr:class I SAM-dependent methyltransferase [Caulobacter sp.]MBO9544897.1 class I SAM-dependent methyltransferase [Caulobacter sp.]
MSYAGPKRFHANARQDYAAFTDAAIRYVANLAPDDRRGLVEKPLDWRPGHPSYFTAMLQLLSALQALNLPPGARIVEVGSGAGWATEILASLWYRVECVEPSPEMIQAARKRVREYLRLRGSEHFYRRVTWQAATMEEAQLEPDSADAVIYFESFHHVVDEHVALEKTLNALRPGGQLVILGDSNWIPGNVEQEAALAAEMAAYGTLESPLTADYMTWLLAEKGFVDIKRCHLVNGLTPTDREAEPVRTFALMDAHWVNLAIARKPQDGASSAPEDEYPYGRPLEDKPPSSAGYRLRQAVSRQLRNLADVISGR